MQNEEVNNDFEKLQEIRMKLKWEKKTLLELEDNIKNSPILTVTSPIRNACHYVQKYLMIQQKRIAEDFKRFNSEFNLLSVQEAKLQGEIQLIQNKLMNTIEQKKHWQEESEKAESALKFQESGLRIAKNMFDVKFNMDIEIEDKTRETFVAVVHFDKENVNKPVKFIINYLQRKIIDFDASSVLSSAEERELKKKFKGYDNIQAFTCALRDQVSKN